MSEDQNINPYHHEKHKFHITKTKFALNVISSNFLSLI